MPTTFNIGIDWNRDGLICWDAQPGDPLNLIPTALRHSQIDISGHNGGSVESYKLMIENGKAVTFEATLKPATSTSPVWGVV